MIIGVDAGCLGIDDQRLEVGVYQFAVNFLTSLSKIDSENTYYLYSFKPISSTLLRELSSNFKNKVIKPEKGWFKIRLPFQLRIDRVDLFLALSQAMPSHHPFRTIGFIHALDFYDKFHDAGSNKKMKANLEYLINNADMLITGSKFLAKSIKKINNTASIKVVKLGVVDEFSHNGNKYKNKEKYFLFVGSLKPSKNLKNIILAFSKFCKDKKNEFNLLIVGSNFWSDENIEGLIKMEKMEKNIKYLGFVKNKNLPAFYRGAIALLSPSLYEGFGLPIIEAIACGCPVIVGNQSAEKEIVSSGGVLVNPLDTNAIAKAMVKIDLKNQFYRSKAIIDSKKFKWDEFASEVYNVINEYEKKT